MLLLLRTLNWWSFQIDILISLFEFSRSNSPQASKLTRKIFVECVRTFVYIGMTIFSPEFSVFSLQSFVFSIKVAFWEILSSKEPLQWSPWTPGRRPRPLSTSSGIGMRLSSKSAKWLLSKVIRFVSKGLFGQGAQIWITFAQWVSV
jgi:hypothetical protein